MDNWSNLLCVRRGNSALAIITSEIISASHVLIPRFMCLEVPRVLLYLGIRYSYYDIDVYGSPTNKGEFLNTSADVVLAVNYFGFPVDLNIFSEHKKKFNSKIIEDNCHGLFSAFNGKYLGTRCDYGIFSARKTSLDLSFGLLYCRNKNPIIAGLDNQNYQPKKCNVRHIKRIAQLLLGKRSTQRLLKIKRKLLSGRETAIEDELDLHTYTIPGQVIGIYEAEKCREFTRRRLFFEKFSKNFGIDFSKHNLFLTDAQLVPMGYIFDPRRADAESIANMADSLGLDVILWPGEQSEKFNNEQTIQSVGVVNFRDG